VTSRCCLPLRRSVAQREPEALSTEMSLNKYQSQTSVPIRRSFSKSEKAAVRRKAQYEGERCRPRNISILRPHSIVENTLSCCLMKARTGP